MINPIIIDELISMIMINRINMSEKNSTLYFKIVPINLLIIIKFLTKIKKLLSIFKTYFIQ